MNALIKSIMLSTLGLTSSLSFATDRLEILESLWREPGRAVIKSDFKNTNKCYDLLKNGTIHDSKINYYQRPSSGGSVFGDEAIDVYEFGGVMNFVFSSDENHIRVEGDVLIGSYSYSAGPYRTKKGMFKAKYLPKQNILLFLANNIDERYNQWSDTHNFSNIDYLYGYCDMVQK